MTTSLGNPDRAALVSHARRVNGQVGALVHLLADERPFGSVAQQLLAARGSIDSLLVRLVELELQDCLPPDTDWQEVDTLLWTAIGRSISPGRRRRSRRPSPPEPNTAKGPLA
ncbi:MAG: metal-sensing transcriptional repressor [Candidatus Limnocylindrales bacterium]